jgi:hypothetical protein
MAKRPKPVAIGVMQLYEYHMPDTLAVHQYPSQSRTFESVIGTLL